ncbi:LysR substrate-binding domain-containing protein [Ideonella paludis]|uniref:LysR family transcriptional regulator n=1 Tax=Ideonella paludis TaxID=1233411 RepID=A0ABS5E314_9BURK|nr:LysR substrate-binding domain-containing protein [Ideonella paludis]MBQ0937762.1 LysR family transcriptional regulator [Ideonella paludis]
MSDTPDHRARLPPLNALRAFEAAGRLGSFVAAAQELHVTHPAIGRHVRLLEEHVGQALLERHARGVQLTPEGRRYHAQVSEAFAVLAAATDELCARQQAAWLRLAVTPGLAARWLQPRLGQFRQLYPDWRVSVEPQPWLTHCPAETDLALMYGDPGDFSGPTEVLLRPAIFPVCSPECLAQHGAPQKASDWLRWPLLHEDEGEWWSDWLRRSGLKRRLHSEVAYGSAETVLQLALQGQGACLSNALLVGSDLEQGRLVRPVAEAHTLQAYVLLERPTGLSPAAQAFKAWLRKEIVIGTPIHT